MRGQVPGGVLLGTSTAVLVPYKVLNRAPQTLDRLAGETRVDPVGVWEVQGPLCERTSGSGGLRAEGGVSPSKFLTTTKKRGPQGLPRAFPPRPLFQAGPLSGVTVQGEAFAGISELVRGLHSFRACHFTHQHQKVARPVSASQNLQRTQMKKRFVDQDGPN